MITQDEIRLACRARLPAAGKLGAGRSAETPACVTGDRSASQQASLSGRQISLVEVLDRVLNKGAVLTGGITISVADIPLLYVGLDLLIASIETVARHQSAVRGTAQADRTKPFPSPLPSP